MKKEIWFIIAIVVVVAMSVPGCSPAATSEPEVEPTAAQEATEVIGYPDGETIREFAYTDAGESRALLVIGSEAQRAMADEINAQVAAQTGTTLPVKLAAEVTDDDKTAYNLILVGTPASNSLLEAAFEELPEELQVTDAYPGQARGVLGVATDLFAPGKDVLVVTGSDAAGTRGSAGNLAAIIAGEPWIVRMRFPAAVLQPLRFGEFSFRKRSDVAIAQEMGYFEFHGVDTKVEKIAGSPPIIAALTSGDIDGGTLSSSAAPLAISKGLPIKYVLGGTNPGRGPDQYIAVLKDSPIESIQDLEGKTIALCFKPTIPWLGILYELKKYGVEADIVEFPPGQYVPPLLAGQVDAAQFTANSVVEYGDQVRLIHTVEVLRKMGSGYWFRTEFLQSKPELMHEWVEALALARRFMTEYPDEALEIAAERSGTPLEELQKRAWGVYDEELTLYVGNLEFVQGLLVEYGLLEEPMDLKEVIDTRFAEPLYETTE